MECRWINWNVAWSHDLWHMSNLPLSSGISGLWHEGSNTAWAARPQLTLAQRKIVICGDFNESNWLLSVPEYWRGWGRGVVHLWVSVCMCAYLFVCSAAWCIRGVHICVYHLWRCILCNACVRYVCARLYVECICGGGEGIQLIIACKEKFWAGSIKKR